MGISFPHSSNYNSLQSDVTAIHAFEQYSSAAAERNRPIWIDSHRFYAVRPFNFRTVSDHIRLDSGRTVREKDEKRPDVRILIRDDVGLIPIGACTAC